MCIVAGLVRLWRATTTSSRFGHWDLQVSCYLPERYVLLPRPSLVGSMEHKSVIMGKGVALTRPAT